MHEVNFCTFSFEQQGNDHGWLNLKIGPILSRCIQQESKRHFGVIIAPKRDRPERYRVKLDDVTSNVVVDLILKLYEQFFLALGAFGI